MPRPESLLSLVVRRSEMADLDGMSVEELKAKVQELLAQKEEDARTIADLKGQLGMPLEAAESPTPAMSSERKTQMELEAEMEKQQQEMYDQMLTDGTLTQEEYDDMMERKEREKEQKAQEQKQKAAWCAPSTYSSPLSLGCRAWPPFALLLRRGE